MELKRYHHEGLQVRRPLLIVPYGIETQTECELWFGRYAFNRTLWN